VTPVDALIAAIAAEDQYDALGADSGCPLDAPLDSRLLARGWRSLGSLTAVDAIIRDIRKPIEANRRWYGWLAKTPDEFVVVVRGTDGWKEWLEDMEGDPMSVMGFPGRVEAGFFGIYSSLAFRSQTDDIAPFAAIKGLVGSPPVTIIGHSLGAALATYLAYDLANPVWLGNGKVSARLFASPHPGDDKFAKAFGERVPDHMMWRNVRDVVPKVPVSLGYSAVPKVTELTPGLDVKDSMACNHHALVYLSLIDPQLDLATVMLPIDKPYAECLGR
jgi:triacylglycerol lipase